MTMTLAVGAPINSIEDLDSLPVGTVIGPRDGNEYRKVGPDNWDFNGVRVYNHTFSLGGHNHIISLPDGHEGRNPMSITQEEFNSITLGGRVYVTTDEGVTPWTRVDGGWSLAGTNPITPDCFATSIAAGMVTLTPEKRAGQWWQSEYTVYRIRAVETEAPRPLKTDSFSLDGTYIRMDQYRATADLGELVDAPEWGRYVEPMLGHLVTMAERERRMERQRDSFRDTQIESDRQHTERRREMVQAHNAELQALRDELAVARSASSVTPVAAAHPLVNRSLESALQEYIEDHTGLTDSERDDLIEVMQNFDMEGPTVMQEVTVTVDVSGSTEHEIDDDDAYEVVGSRNIDHPEGESVTIYWGYSFTVDRDVARNSCACGEVDREMVAARLDDAGIMFTSFDFEVECENC